MMIVVLAAALLASPLSAQAAERAAPSEAWRSVPVPDPRLRADFTGARGGADVAEWGARMQLQHWALLGGAIGCIGGALLMGASADEGEVAATRFNGCILGGAAGMFLGGIYGLATGG